MGKNCGCKKCKSCCPTKISNCCPTQTPFITMCPTPPPTPPFSGPTPTPTICGPCQTAIPLSTCCTLPDDNVCRKVILDCGVRFNNSAYEIGQCAVEFITTGSTNPATPTRLLKLVNIINVGIEGSCTTTFFSLPARGTPLPGNCDKPVECGQLMFVSNIGPCSITIVAMAGINSTSITGNATVDIQPGTGALFILTPAPFNPTGCNWYTLL